MLHLSCERWGGTISAPEKVIMKSHSNDAVTIIIYQLQRTSLFKMTKVKIKKYSLYLQIYSINVGIYSFVFAKAGA